MHFGNYFLHATKHISLHMPSTMINLLYSTLSECACNSIILRHFNSITNPVLIHVDSFNLSLEIEYLQNLNPSHVFAALNECCCKNISLIFNGDSLGDSKEFPKIIFQFTPFFTHSTAPPNKP